LRLCSRAPETTILLPDAIDETFYDGEQTFGCPPVARHASLYSHRYTGDARRLYLLATQ
jgi:hypothetical protein